MDKRMNHPGRSVNSPIEIQCPLSWPLVVVLDGTLTPCDTLMESLVLVLKRNPWDLFRLFLWLCKGRAAFKAFVASRVDLSVVQMPFREDVLSYLRIEKDKGRRIVLATAAHRTVADKVASHLALFDDQLASDDVRNLKGPEKLRAIRERLTGEFIYAADSSSDLVIWEAASAGVLVGASSNTARIARRLTNVVREFPAGTTTAKALVSAFRPHQWLKNALLFVPLLTAFDFADLQKVFAALFAFAAFSLAASASYMANDLLDLENDRAHPRKRSRPFASGRLSIRSGVVTAICALTIALVLASAVSAGFLVILLAYMVLTTAYSLTLKQRPLIDVLTLSLLYTLRIVAGAVAINVVVSSWLLAFSVFTFFSLALVKRVSELLTLEQAGHRAARGRDYMYTDLVVLWPLGIGAGMCAVVVFGLFISAPETSARYSSPEILWLAAVGLIYWLSRLWMKTARGQMHDDPLVFALRDRGSIVTMAGMIFVTLIAHYVRLDYL